MNIKTSLKNVIGATIVAGALLSGTSSAATITGKVAYTSTNGGSSYTFVNILTPTGNAVAFYNGSNTAIATILDNAKRMSQNVTIVTNDSTYQITQVR